MRARRGFVAAVASVLLTAACGGGPTAVTVVAGSPSRTASARTARVSSVVRITGSSGPLTAGRSLQADGSVDFASRQATFRVTTETGSIDAVIDGAVVYERIPQLAPAVGRKTWLKIDFRTAGQLAGVPGVSSVLESQPSDPSQTLSYLRGASGPMTTLGHARVRGVATTHYRVPVDLNRAAASLGPDQQAALRQEIDELGLKTTFPMEVWIDGQGRVRRMHLVQDYSQVNPPPNVPRGSPSSSVEQTMELFDFGAPVTVQPPPADQVTDISALVNRSHS